MLLENLFGRKVEGKKVEAIERHSRTYTFPGRVKRDFGSHLPKIEEGTILDAGCSDGHTTRELSELYPRCHVIGIDCNKDSCKHARGLHNDLEFHVGNFYKLSDNFPPDYFTAIFAMNNLTAVSHNLSRRELLAIFDNFNRSLKDGGYLCISDDIGWDPKLAILKKKGEEFSEVYVSPIFRVRNTFGYMPEACGIKR